MPESLLSPTDFAGRIRQKYPGAYDDLSDDDLVSKVTIKYPEYKSQINWEMPKAGAAADPTTQGTLRALTGYETPVLESLERGLGGSGRLAQKATELSGLLRPLGWLAGVTPAGVARALPDIGGAIGGGAAALSGAGLPLSAGAAALGGASGEAIRQSLNQKFAGAPPPSLGEAARATLGQGAIQGAFDLAGGVLAAPFKAGAKSLGKAAKAESETLAGQLGLPPRPPGASRWLIENTMTGKRVASRQAAKGLEKAGVAAEEAASRAGLALPPPQRTPQALEEFVQQAKTATQAGNIPGARAQIDQALSRMTKEGRPVVLGDITQRGIRSGEDVAQAEAERQFANVDQLAAGLSIDTTPYREALQQLKLEGVSDSGIKQLMREVAPKQKGRLPLPTEMSFEQARGLQKRLGQMLKSSAQMLSPDAHLGARRLLWERLTDSLQKGLEEQAPEAAEAFAGATGFYKQYSEVFKRGLPADLVKQYPEDVAGRISSPSRAQEVREAVLGYPSRYGVPSEQKAAQEAMDSVSRAWTQTHLLRGGIDKLGKNLANEENQEIFEHVFTTPQSKEALQNLQQISGAMEKAQADLDQIGKVVGQSEAAQRSGRGIAGLSVGAALYFYLRTAYGLSVGAAVELLGGATAWAAYNKARAAALSEAIGSFVHGSTTNFARFVDAYMKQGGLGQPPPRRENPARDERTSDLVERGREGSLSDDELDELELTRR